MITRNHKNKKILDLGCGEGLSTQYLASHFKINDAEIIGIDKDEIKIMKAHYNFPHLSFGIDDIRNSKLPNDTIDILFVKNVFHEIEPSDFDGVIFNIKRICKKQDSLIYLNHEINNNQLDYNLKNFNQHFNLVHSISDSDSLISIAKYQ
jgi:ubiquinone/menaquinone biosynthesis C-methylase UbiE